MKTYYVEVTEVLKKVVQVRATDPDDALYKVSDAYDECELVLDSSDHISTDFNLMKDPEDWIKSKATILGGE